MVASQQSKPDACRLESERGGRGKLQHAGSKMKACLLAYWIICLSACYLPHPSLICSSAHTVCKPNFHTWVTRMIASACPLLISLLAVKLACQPPARRESLEQWPAGRKSFGWHPPPPPPPSFSDETGERGRPMKPNVEWTNATSYVSAPGYLALSTAAREVMANLATGQFDWEGAGQFGR